MAKLFKIVIATGTKTINVVAETAEEAQTKVTPAEGEVVVEVTDGGEVIA